MTYSGIFLRHYLGQTPTDTGSAAWCESPDLIPYGQTIAPDVSIFTKTAGYANPFSANVTENVNNYVYLRGLNTANGSQKSRMYFYFTESDLALWPVNWRSDSLTVNTISQNWVDVSASAPNQVVVTQTPIVWVPPTLHGSQWDHFCIVGWVDNSYDPQPPDFATLGHMNSLEQLAQFIISHPNMAWRNTVDVYVPPPNETNAVGLTIPSSGATAYLQVTFPHLPLDGTFSVNLQGSSSSNSVALPQSPLSQYQGGFIPVNSPLSFEGGLNTSVQVQYWQGKTAVPPGGKIQIKLMIETGPELNSMLNMLSRNMRPPIEHLSIEGFEPITVMTIGAQTFNIKYGQKPD